MPDGSFLLVFVLGLGLMLALLYLSTLNSIQVTIPTEPRISQDDAISIAETDLKGRFDNYNGITGIIVNNTSGYVPYDEFNDKHLKLPLVYVHPNGTLIRITENGYENMGQCNIGLAAYCGYLEPYYFDYSGKLVYGVELQAWHDDVKGIPFLYIVDATDGRIVDSTFLRSEAQR